MGDMVAAKIFVAGHKGMVGSAIVRALEARGEHELVLASHAELDLTRQQDVEDFFAREKPSQVYMAAGHVGGIGANSRANAAFLYDNAIMAMNVINAAWQSGTEKLLYLGSSCIYPREAPQPITEDALLSSALEQTNEGYALAKIAGLKLCSFLKRDHGANFISCMPCNLYGPGDNYHPSNSHVLPALIRRFHEAKEAGVAEVVCWGDGSPLREFLNCDDLARACVHLMDVYDGEQTINVGSGTEISIFDLAQLVARIVGFEGAISWDSTKPNGTPRKLLDVSRIHELGWHHQIGLEEGIRDAYEDFKARLAAGQIV